MTISAACVTFPGSNCDQDIHRAVGLMGWELVKLWHENSLDREVDVVFVPGGFSYGDYLRCGALARFSPAMASLRQHEARGGLVVGICNGFQILCEAGMLPGALTRNAGLKFRCLWTHLKVANADTAFTSAATAGAVLRVPIAHGEGNYFAHPDELKRLQDNGQIVFQYCDAAGAVSAESNPNGSISSIAGIQNERGNVLGMMPHPERAMEPILGGEDGRILFNSLEHALARAGA
ncbi:phosphoribosylformylglycinamidine synthase subunit PurQ [soil metagenome]